MGTLRNLLQGRRVALEAQCRERARDSGLDGRTSYFAEILRGEHAFSDLRRWARLRRGPAERLMRQFLETRYSTYTKRSEHGIVSDVPESVRILSQGYKRGLTWRGVPLGKTCFDIAIYQQLIQDLRPKTLIEFGTGLGASTMFFADTCRTFGLETRVITLDVDGGSVDAQLEGYPEIEFVAGDAKHVATLLPEERLRSLSHPWLIVEDCHVYVPEIVSHLSASMATGDYLLIEDIGHVPEWRVAIDEALASIPGDVFEVDCHYTDLFGRNATCSADAIFRKT